MNVIIRLQGLPWSANALDIRRYFQGLSIPEGGVHIVGGELGDAFIAFSSDEDARQAMLMDGGKIKEIRIKLFLSSRSEMQKVIEFARTQSLALQGMVPPGAPQQNVTSPPPPKPPVQDVERPMRISPERKEPDRRDRRDRSRDRSRDRERERERGRDRRGRDRSRSRSPRRMRDKEREDKRGGRRGDDRRDDRTKREGSFSGGRKRNDESRDHGLPIPDNRRGALHEGAGEPPMIQNGMNVGGLPAPSMGSLSNRSDYLSNKEGMLPPNEAQEPPWQEPAYPGPGPRGWMDDPPNRHPPDERRPEGLLQTPSQPRRGPSGGAQDWDTRAIDSFSRNIPPPVNSSTRWGDPVATYPSESDGDMREHHESFNRPLPGGLPPVHPFPDRRVGRGRGRGGGDPFSLEAHEPFHPHDITPDRRLPPGPREPHEMSSDRRIPPGPRDPHDMLPDRRIPTGPRDPHEMPPDRRIPPGPRDPHEMPPERRIPPGPRDPHEMPPDRRIPPGSRDPHDMPHDRRGPPGPRDPHDMPPDRRIPPSQRDPHDIPSERMGPGPRDLHDMPMDRRMGPTIREPHDIHTDRRMGSVSRDAIDMPDRRILSGPRDPHDMPSDRRIPPGARDPHDMLSERRILSGPREPHDIISDRRIPPGQREHHDMPPDRRILSGPREHVDMPPDRRIPSGPRGEPHDLLPERRLGPGPRDSLHHDSRDNIDRRGRSINDPFMPNSRDSPHHDLQRSHDGFPPEGRGPPTERRPRDPFPPTGRMAPESFPPEANERHHRDSVHPSDPFRQSDRRMPPLDEPYHRMDSHSYPPNRPPLRGSMMDSDSRIPPKFGGRGGPPGSLPPNGRAPHPGDRFYDEAPSKRSRLSESRCIELRGLPYNVTHKDVREFLRGLSIVPDGIKLLGDERGQKVTAAVVRFISESDKNEALKRNKQYLGNRYVDVVPCSEGVFEKAIGLFMSSQPSIDKRMPKMPLEERTCVLVKGLPSSCKEDDVVKLFDGLKIINILMECDRGGKRSGNAMIEFASSDDAKQAVQGEPKKFGSRSLDLILASKESMLSKYGPDSDLKKNDESLQNIPPHVASSRYTDCIMQGLPDHCTDRDIIEFFSAVNIIPLTIHIMLTKDGQPSGDAFCEFKSPQECETALRKNNHYMDDHYISVKPVPRSEMLEALGIPNLDVMPPHPRMDIKGPRPPMMGRPNERPSSDRRTLLDRPPRELPLLDRPMSDHSHPDMDHPMDSQLLPDHLPRIPEAFGKPGCVIAAKNIPYRATIEEILELFHDYGITKDSLLRRYNEKGQPTGDARIAFKSPAEAQKALQDLNLRLIGGRPISLFLL